MIVIYHNPESLYPNKGIEILETSKHDQELLKYEGKPIDEIKLTKVIKLLGVNPLELIRKNCKIWLEQFEPLINKGIDFSKDELIKIMIEHQELIEHPIIINSDKAVIGEPAKKIIAISS